MSYMSVLALASDDRLSGRLVEWRAPRWVRVWMLTATRLGDGGIWILTAVLLAASGLRGLQVLGAGAVAAAIANVLLVLVKRRVQRSRPWERAKPHSFEVAPLAWFPSDRFSFPSGHALNSFAVGSVIALAFPPVAVPVLALAASVAASRVLLGLHWLSDVLAGAFAGLVIGGAIWLALLR
jgi:undecaprenyl-diphosphatase